MEVWRSLSTPLSLEIKSSSKMTTSAPLKGKISDEQFKFFTEYLASRYGLRIAKEKRSLLESRLISRLNTLKFDTIEQYIDFTFNSKDSNNEYQYFVEQITTHKTFFFRENYQFEFLSKNIEAYLKKRGAGNMVHAWSAGCSTGEEVYTLGMVLNEKRKDISLDFKLVGTDISIPSLKKAAIGKFTAELENIPTSLKEKYFIADPSGNGLHFNHPEIKSKIQLGVLNLNNKAYNLPHTFDFVFCRNVTIYFDAHTRGEVLKRIVDKLRPGGYLFLGHSETALGTTLPIKGIQPTIYQKL
jgi:chemotaxis protein methyltransferase CheR